jgi:hypothetical protein
MNKPARRFKNEEELFEYLDKSGLGERLRKGEREAFKEYFELNGAKITRIEDRQPAKK